jgi:hypothetical protein
MLMRAKVIFSLVLALAVVAVLAASALGGDAAKPSVAFATPKGAVTGSQVTFRVKLWNFSIDAANVGMRNLANRGHLRFALDGGRFDYPKYSGPNGKLAAQLGIAGTYSPSVAPSITYNRLPRGRHTVTVFLVRNDHTNYGPRARIAFTVR